MKKFISILGSTGSIGTSALEVIDHLGQDYTVSALASYGNNLDLVVQQANKYKPELIAIYDKDKALELSKRLPSFKIVGGMEGLCESASIDSANITLSAMTGTLGLEPTMSAIKAKKTLALANKEALVSGGEWVMRAAKENKVSILPVDSEHSALFQCLVGEDQQAISRLILTASGGPFRTYGMDQLSQIKKEQAMLHPTWKMGPKITCDCSTLMNKGLEMIEAHFLFNVPVENIEVVVHPQSIIHSMVEFVDGSMKAQMSAPDMKVPIQYAFTYPRRNKGLLKPFDFIRHEKLEFHQADTQKFRCLALAYQALRQGGSMPCYMNAANEVLVERFIKDQLTWLEIGSKLEQLMQLHKVVEIHSLETLLGIDQLARRDASNA